MNSMTTYLAYGKICNKRAANEKGGNCGKLQTDTDLGCVFLRITVTDYTKITRLASLSYANTSGTSFGTMNRVDAGLSSDKTKLLIAARNTDGDIQYSIYDAETLNILLDAKENQA